MHRGEPHTVRSHLVEELEAFIDTERIVSTLISGQIVKVVPDLDRPGYAHAVFIKDLDDQVHVVSGVHILDEYKDEYEDADDKR